MKKATDAEMEARIQIVGSLILNGFSRPEIIEHCRKTWGVGRAAADQYTARARAEIFDINQDDIQETIQIITRQFWRQYRKADEKNDIYAATTVLRELAKVKGLGQITLNLNKSDGDPLPDVSAEDLVAVATQETH